MVAEGAHQVHGEEGQPAQHEQTDNDGERFGRFRFDAEAFRLRLDVANAAAGAMLLAGAAARKGGAAAAAAAAWTAVRVMCIRSGERVTGR